MSNPAFANLIKQSRATVGLSPQELGELVDRSPSTVRNWERGTSVPTQDEVYEALAEALGVEEQDLRLAATQDREEPSQPVESAAEESGPRPAATARASLTAGSYAVPGALPGPEPRSYRDDPRDMITYWVRGLLTAAGLLVLILILVVAAGAMFENLGDVLQVFRD